MDYIRRRRLYPRPRSSLDLCGPRETTWGTDIICAHSCTRDPAVASTQAPDAPWLQLHTSPPDRSV